jgi:hypothetical protein
MRCGYKNYLGPVSVSVRAIITAAQRASLRFLENFYNILDPSLPSGPPH